MVFCLALALDALGELPTPVHPVHWLGRFIQSLQRKLPRGRARPLAGAVLALLPAGLAWVGAAACIRLARRAPAPVAIALEAALLKQTFAARSLFDHAARVQQDLAAGDLPAARASAARIVGRPTQDLPAGLLASAAIESVAENYPDSILAPWLAFALAGTPGAAACRAVNTGDAIVGYRHYGSLGAPTAYLDDALNLLPARIAAGLLALASPAPARAWSGARRDARRPASPNSGWPMAAMAAALDRRLEKRDHYILNGDRPLPQPADVTRAITITRRAVWLGAACTAALLLARR